MSKYSSYQVSPATTTLCRLGLLMLAASYLPTATARGIADGEVSVSDLSLNATFTGILSNLGLQSPNPAELSQLATGRLVCFHEDGALGFEDYRRFIAPIVATLPLIIAQNFAAISASLMRDAGQSLAAIYYAAESALAQCPKPAKKEVELIAPERGGDNIYHGLLRSQEEAFMKAGRYLIAKGNLPAIFLDDYNQRYGTTRMSVASPLLNGLAAYESYNEILGLIEVIASFKRVSLLLQRDQVGNNIFAVLAAVPPCDTDLDAYTKVWQKLATTLTSSQVRSALAQQDAFGNTPLHYLILHAGEAQFDRVMNLISPFLSPEHFIVRNKAGESVLDVAKLSSEEVAHRMNANTFEFLPIASPGSKRDYGIGRVDLTNLRKESTQAVCRVDGKASESGLIRFAQGDPVFDDKGIVFCPNSDPTVAARYGIKEAPDSRAELARMGRDRNVAPHGEWSKHIERFTKTGSYLDRSTSAMPHKLAKVAELLRNIGAEFVGDAVVIGDNICELRPKPFPGHPKLAPSDQQRPSR